LGGIGSTNSSILIAALQGGKRQAQTTLVMESYKDYITPIAFPVKVYFVAKMA
jgi:hypothetical protein